jgi:ribosomal protein S18 acetylase RimI-like enzyme
VLGTLNLKPEGEGTVLLRSLAVDSKCQGTGVGKKLVLFAHEVARERGFRRIVLHSRLNVIGFYQKLGYTLTGNRIETPKITLAEMELNLL